MNKAKAFSLLLIFVSLTVSVSPPITAARMRDLRSAHLTEMTGAPSGYDEDSSGVAPTTTGDVPPPLPTDCDGVGPPIPACCLFGYVYYDDATVAGVAVHIESPHGTLDTLTTSGWASDEPYYVASLSTSPLNVSPGDVITITASYSDMVSTRTWTVQGAGQHVDLGLVTGFQSPGSVTELGAGESESESAMLHDHSRTAAAAPQGIPLTFIENVGQFDERARFQVRNGDTTLFLAKDALWVTMIEPSSQPVSTTNLEALATAGQETEMASNRRVNLKLSFVGANPHPRLEPLDKSAARVSFFTGNDPDRWHTDVPAWGGVRYVDLYPGVDLELRGQNGGLEQRLVVRESGSGSRLASHNSHLSDVRLRVEGVEDLALDGNHLKLTTALGDLALPLLTVEETNPDAEPAVRKIEDETYEVSFPFASAPSFTARFIEAAGGSALSYSTYLGGRGDDIGCDITADSAGNVYITGRTISSDFVTTTGAYDDSFNGDYDVFVSKVSADGDDIMYSTYIGGDGPDGGEAIKVDDAGNVFIAGSTSSENFPTTPGALDADLDGGRDVFVAKLNAAGDALIYSTYLGGSSWEYGFDIAVDDAGNAYVGGFTHGSFPTTPGAFQTAFGGAWDGYVSKLNIDGSALLYSTYLGGSGGDSVFGIAVDEIGSAYITGEASSTNFPTTPGAWDTTCNNCQTNVSQDGFVAKLNADGNTLIYSTLIGGNTPAYPEVFLGIAVDGAGNAYVAGRTTGDDFPTTPNALQPDFDGGSRDAVVVKLNADGSALLYSTYLGGSGTDDVRSIAIDSLGNAYVTGRTSSTDFPLVSPLQATNGGAYDAFATKLNSDGSALLYSTYLGGNGDENMVGSEPHHLTGGITLDDTGNVYLIGVTGSPDFPTANPLQPTFGGGSFDVFVTKLSLNEAPPSLFYSTYLGGSGEDRPFDIALDSAGNVHIVGETSSTDFPITPGAYNASYGGDPTDVFVTKLSAGGSTLVYSTYLGGNDEDAGNGITVDSAGNVYLTGKTYSTNFPTTPGALDTTLSGGRDAFVAKLNAAGDALIYSTYLGGTNWDYGFCIAIDDSDNAYVGGFTHGSFPVTSGAAQTTFGGSGDGFAVKLSPDGRTLLYSTYLGGYSWEGIDGIVIDNAGNAYLASHTHSTDFPTTPGAWDRVCDNCQTNFSTDGAVAKLNADGSAFIYSTLIGGADAPGVDVFTDISIDSAGNAYLTGHTSSADFPTTTGALQPDFGGGNDDAVVVKLNADGSDLLYSTYLGGSDADRGYGIAIDNDGTAYLTGYTASTDFATVDPLQASNAGGYDAFVAKVNDAGSALLYSTYLGGSGDENCFNSPLGHADIALDRTRNIYLTGFTGSTDLPTTNNAYDMSFNGGNYDAFVTKIRMNECGWSLTSSLADGRHGHTATLLSNGRVLVVGGIQERTAAGPGLANAEIYDPIGGTWSATGSLKTGRWGHSATLLPDGRVLVVGGRDVFSGPALASVEVYDPVSGTWSSAAPLSVPRGSHTATRLSDGRVLVVGGRYSTSNPDVHASAEIYDPTSGTWSPTGSLNTPRESHSATLLSDGRVLVVNGYYQSWLASAEIYSPAGRTWSEIPPPLSCHGVAHTATLLADGRVLVVGGACGSGTPGISDGAEIYDPVASTWTANTDLPEAREVHTATLLPDGTVLIVGGDDGDVPRYDSALIYNPASGTWTSAGSLAIGRRNHTATLLNDGRVLIVAGWGDTTTYLDHAEIYHAHCVASPPVAAFTAIPRSGNIPLDVHFTDQSSGDIIAWDWTFGDGGISGARHPEHEYTNDGTYSLALTVTGPGSSDTESKLDYITVIEPTWTFMLYLDGDNNLDRWLKRAFARLDAASANPHVAIVVQIDGPGSADTWRYKIQPGADHSWYMGELDMGDPQTLSDFILWARETYPADHTYLAVADHGRGTTGIAWDETTGNNEFITVSELWTALHGATDDGAKPLDVVHYDACLMAMLEDAYQIKNYTRYLVASQNLTWGAFAYDAYATPVTTTTTPLELATTVADAYHRAVTGFPHTISALDIGEVGTVADAVTDLANALMADLDAVRNHVTDSRNKAQKLDSRNYYDITNDDEYVDLYDLAWLLKENVPDNDVKNAAQDVMDKIADLVTTEYHESGVYHDNPRWDLDDTHGVSIYFPEDIWSSDYEDYLEHNLFRFTIDTQWDDFLHDHIGDPGFGILPPPPPPVLMYHLVYLPFVIR